MHDAMLMLFTGISPLTLQGGCAITGSYQRKLDVTSDSQEVNTGNVRQELLLLLFHFCLFFWAKFKKKRCAV